MDRNGFFLSALRASVVIFFPKPVNGYLLCKHDSVSRVALRGNPSYPKPQRPSDILAQGKIYQIQNSPPFVPCQIQQTPQTETFILHGPDKNYGF